MKNIKYIILAVVAIAFASCNDFLSEMPDDRTVIDTPEKVGELLTFAYPNQNHQMFCYGMSDNATDKGKSARKNMINNDAYHWADFRLTSQDTPNSYWTSCYAAIKQANHALDAINDFKVDGKIPNSVKAFYGEALIARAYCHFMLANLWSVSYNPKTATTDLGIPYVTKPETNVLTKYTRGTVASVYENIEKDIIEGLKYIDDKAYVNKKLHWNTTAANIFAARFYSLKGDFNKVLEHTNKVLVGNPADLIRDLTGAYKKMDVNEAILEWGKTGEKTNQLVVPQYSSWFVYTYGTYQYGMDINFHKFVFRNCFVDSKAQWAWTLYGGDPDIFFAKWGFHKESTGVNSDVGYYMIMNVLVDMEEALFLRMEANTMLKKYTAVATDMDAYLSRRLNNYNPTTYKVTFAAMQKEYKKGTDYDYGLNPFYELDDTQRVYINCLYDFRRKEYYYTGMHWFDQRRFNTKVRHYFADGTTKWLTENDLRKQLQIPLSAQAQGIEANPR